MKSRPGHRACKKRDGRPRGRVDRPLPEAASIAIIGPDPILVTPGVRSPGAAKGDQKRVATPAEALRAGANYVVMGRQITLSPDPAAEVDRVLEELFSAM